MLQDQPTPEPGKTSAPPKPNSQLLHQQIGLLKDRQKISLQGRFEQFCHNAIAAQTQVDERGEPIFNAGSAKSVFHVKVEVVRTANNSMVFDIRPSVDESHPQIPGLLKTSQVVFGI